MNREQIIQMAQQCGFTKTHSGVVNLWLANADDIERFAKLVAEHERERILDICKEGLWDAEGIRYHLNKQDREQA